MHKFYVRIYVRNEIMASIGYSCTLFVEFPPEYIRCGVCSNVLRDPQLTECCGRNVCHPCIKGIISTVSSCPLAECRKPHVKVSFNRKCRNDIDEYRVYCSSKSNGCDWTDKLEKLERHLADCGFVEEKCQYCGTFVQRCNVKCHEAVCKQYPIECQCGVTYERQHQAPHLVTCSLALIKCPFKIVGCESEVLNKDLSQHFSECLPDHHALVAKQSHDVRVKFEESKELLLREYKEKKTQLDAEINRLSIAILAARERIAALQNTLCKREEEMRDLQSAQDTAKYSFADQVGVGDAEIQTLREGIDQLHFDFKVKLYGQPLPQPHPIVSRPIPPTTDPLIPPLTFTVINFLDKKKHDAVVCTQPFLTHYRGYKMCLQIHCNGYGRGRGNWLSIYAYLLKGEYDDFLVWPFHGSITVKIRNLLYKSQNHVKTITFDSNHGTRVEGDEYFSSSHRLGHWNFMSLSRFYPKSRMFPDFQYLHNGCLQIDMSKVNL